MGADAGRDQVVGEAVTAAAGEVAAVRAAAEGEQLPMFAVPTRFSGLRAVDAAAPEAARQAERIERIGRERGRPAGAANKATQQWRDYLLARGVNPLETMMRWSLHTPETLAAELACSKLEAYDRLKALWSELAPYFFARKVPVDDAGNAVPFFNLVIGGGNGAVAVAADGQPPWVYAMDPGVERPEQKQALSAPLGEVSHGGVSHGTDK